MSEGIRAEMRTMSSWPSLHRDGAEAGRFIGSLTLSGVAGGGRFAEVRGFSPRGDKKMSRGGSADRLSPQGGEQKRRGGGQVRPETMTGGRVKVLWTQDSGHRNTSPSDTSGTGDRSVTRLGQPLEILRMAVGFIDH